MNLGTRGRKLINTASHQVHRMREALENRRVLKFAPKTRAEMLAAEREHWGDEDHAGGWLASPTLMRAMNTLISGDPEVYWLLHVKKRYYPDEPCTYLATLGCGDGGLERNAYAIDLADHCDGYDLAPQAISTSRALLSPEYHSRTQYHEVDLNECELPRKLYDLIISPSCIHHLDKLEHVLEQVKRALSPGGLFVLHEYVGPSVFQWTDAQLDAANDALAQFPPDRRGPVTRIYRPPADMTRRSSPFEAIRSAEIIPLIDQHFEWIERVDIGGGLLQPLLENTYTYFNEDNSADRELLMSLWQKERELMAAGVLDTNFVYGVCAPK